MNIAFPFRVDPTGRTATATSSDHVRQMIEVTLFTEPGERVNRPDFGCGLMQLVFSGRSSSESTAIAAVVQAALQRGLGELADIRDVRVEFSADTLAATVEFVATGRKEREVLHIERVI